MRLNILSLVILMLACLVGYCVYSKTQDLVSGDAMPIWIAVLLGFGAAIAALKVMVWIRWKIHRKKET